MPKSKEEQARDALWSDVIRRHGGNLSAAAPDLTRLGEDGESRPYTIGHVRRVVGSSKLLARVTKQARIDSDMPNRGPRAKVSAVRLLKYDPSQIRTLEECANHFDVSSRRVAALRAQMAKDGR